jgi:hypothetical protein
MAGKFLLSGLIKKDTDTGQGTTLEWSRVPSKDNLEHTHERWDWQTQESPPPRGQKVITPTPLKGEAGSFPKKHGYTEKRQSLKVYSLKFHFVCFHFHSSGR